MNSNNSSRRAWAIGVASILAMGGVLILPSLPRRISSAAIAARQ